MMAWGCVKKKQFDWLLNSHWFYLDMFGVAGLIILIEAWRQWYVQLFFEIFRLIHGFWMENMFNFTLVMWEEVSLHQRRVYTRNQWPLMGILLRNTPTQPEINNILLTCHFVTPRKLTEVKPPAKLQGDCLYSTCVRYPFLSTTTKQ